MQEFIFSLGFYPAVVLNTEIQKYGSLLVKKKKRQTEEEVSLIIYDLQDLRSLLYF